MPLPEGILASAQESTPVAKDLHWLPRVSLSLERVEWKWKLQMPFLVVYFFPIDL